MTKPNNDATKEKVKTQSEKLWDEIKDVKIEMFSLPSQPLNKYAKMMPIDPTKLYITYNAPALLPALETALGSKYNVELVDKYIVVKKA